MQTEILFKQVTTALAELKTAIDKFEKHVPPSTQYADALLTKMSEANKYIAAYVVLKEQKDVSPELNLHLKIMSAKDLASENDPIKKLVIEKVEIPKEMDTTLNKIEIQTPREKPVEEIPAATLDQVSVEHAKQQHPKLVIAINDKFRFINELFDANTNEYNIAIEQLNTVNSLDEAEIYLKGLKSIYGWDDENEMTKKLISLNQKRFT